MPGSPHLKHKDKEERDSYNMQENGKSMFLEFQFFLNKGLELGLFVSWDTLEMCLYNMNLGQCIVVHHAPISF